MGTILNYSAIATPLSIWFDDVCCLSASYHHADTCGFYDAAILTTPHHTTGGLIGLPGSTFQFVSEAPKPSAATIASGLASGTHPTPPARI